MRSAKHLEAVELVRGLLLGLGFASPVDGRVVEREAFATGFVCNLVDDPTFQNQKRINELFELRKSSSIHADMDTKQMLLWTNSLLKPFGLRVSPINRNGKGYQLVVLSDLLGLIKRKNARGRFYEDRENLLRQESRDGDPFVDGATGETLTEKRETRDFDTSRLDVRVGGDED